MFLFPTLALWTRCIRKMYLKVLCCVHFTAKLTESCIYHEVNCHFDCSHDENHEVVVVKCYCCIHHIPGGFYHNHLRHSRCICKDMGGQKKCSTFTLVCKVINTVALKNCIRKEQFPTGQIYFSIKKYLYHLSGDGFFVYSKQDNIVYYRFDYPKWGRFFSIRKLCSLIVGFLCNY